VASRPEWFQPVSRFILEVNPIICAIAIGSYVLSGLLPIHPAATKVALARPPAADFSGEEVTAMVQTAHAAARAAAMRKTERDMASAEPAPAATPAHPHRTLAAAKERTARVAPRQTAIQPVPAQPVPAQPAMAEPPAPPMQIVRAEEPRSWYGRTIDRVSGWGGTVARTTRLDDAASLAVAAPGAVMRAGVRTVDFVAGAILPGR